MVAEYFHGEKMTWGSCIVKRPMAFAKGFFAGLAVLSVVVAGVIGWYQSQQPVFRPTLKLAETTVMTGGYLGFYQGEVPPQRCPQETVRMISRVNANGKREIYPLPDFNIVPKLGQEQSIVYFRLPDAIQPGTWYYTRETAQWCSWFNFFTRPTITRTADVPFEVIARGEPKG